MSAVSGTTRGQQTEERNLYSFLQKEFSSNFSQKWPQASIFPNQQKWPWEFLF